MGCEAYCGDPERFLLAWTGYILSAIILQTIVSFDSASHLGTSHARHTVELLHKFWFHCAIRACLSWRQAQTLVSCCFRMTAAVECFFFFFFSWRHDCERKLHFWMMGRGPYWLIWTTGEPVSICTKALSCNWCISLLQKTTTKIKQKKSSVIN